MRFRIWCRWGEAPLKTTDFNAAVEVAIAYAYRNGLYVVLLNQDREIVLEVPPALQTSMVVPLLFGGEDDADYLGMFNINE
jgi:hypothetical protein